METWGAEAMNPRRPTLTKAATDELAAALVDRSRRRVTTPILLRAKTYASPLEQELRAESERSAEAEARLPETHRQRDLEGPPEPPSLRDPSERLPREMKPEDVRRPGHKDLLGALLAAAQGADLYMTDRGIDTPTRRPTPEEITAAGYDASRPEDYVLSPFREGNPLPGMQDPRGRIAWGSLENKALEVARRKKPALGVPATVAAALIHLMFAKRWNDKIHKYGEGR